MEYLLSIIIPTKNRSNYLKGCLDSLIKLGDKDIEIVVQDNSDDNSQIVDYIKNIDHKNLKYYHCKDQLTQTENSELAVSNATGKYICYIGDDDSISNMLIEAVKLMNRYEIEALNCNMATFYWPDIVFNGTKLPFLSFDKTKLKIEKINSKEILYRYLRNGFQSIRFLPRTYHAVIARSILDKVKLKSGKIFPGPSPDMANAVACSLVVHNHIYINAPLIISGASYSSACGMGMRGAHKGSLKGVAQIANDVEEKWNKNIPKLWLGNTIWPESAVKALEAMGAGDFIEKMNWYAVYARMLLKYGEYRSYTMQFIHGIGYLRVFFDIISDVSNWLIDRVIYKIRFLRGSWYVNYQENLSLQEACEITNKYLEETGFYAEITEIMARKVR